MKSYSELVKLKSFEERLAYLKLLDNNVKSPRHMSSDFYKSHTWRTIRQQIIERDSGFDLGVFGVYVPDGIIVHHINPIDVNDILYHTPKLTDFQNLITTSVNTHNLIHYNTKEKSVWVDRAPDDTKFW